MDMVKNEHGYLVHENLKSAASQRFKRQFHKMVKQTQTISRQFADELFECVGPFCGIGA